MLTANHGQYAFDNSGAAAAELSGGAEGGAGPLEPGSCAGAAHTSQNAADERFENVHCEHNHDDVLCDGGADARAEGTAAAASSGLFCTFAW